MTAGQPAALTDRIVRVAGGYEALGAAILLQAVEEAREGRKMATRWVHSDAARQLLSLVAPSHDVDDLHARLVKRAEPRPSRRARLNRPPSITETPTPR